MLFYTNAAMIIWLPIFNFVSAQELDSSGLG